MTNARNARYIVHRHVLEIPQENAKNMQLDRSHARHILDLYYICRTHTRPNERNMLDIYWNQTRHRPGFYDSMNLLRHCALFLLYICMCPLGSTKPKWLSIFTQENHCNTRHSVEVKGWFLFTAHRKFFLTSTTLQVPESSKAFNGSAFPPLLVRTSAIIAGLGTHFT